MTKIQNGRHFDMYAPKWPILLLVSGYQYSLASFSTRKSQKIKKLKMTKIQNGAILTCLRQNGRF